MPDPKKYPKCKYHAAEPACVVADEKEEAALGEGWFDHPNLVKYPTVVELPKPAKAKPIKADDSK